MEADGPGGGLMPYTVEFPGDDGVHAADLEHGAPLPRVGDTVEYIDERGTERLFRVCDVIHTLQSAADMRPTIQDQPLPPHAFGRPADVAAEEPGAVAALRAGLPRVVLELIER